MWIGSVLALCGLGCAVASFAWYRTRTWYLLEMPIQLTIGHIRTAEFKTNVEENFEIQLAVDRDVPRSLTEGLLGIGDLATGDVKDGGGFKLAWSVRGDDRIVKQGISGGIREGFWGASVGRRLGYFHATKGTKYNLDLDVLENAKELSPYHPRIVVTIDLFTLDGYAMADGFSQLAGFGVAGIGGLLMIIAFALKWADRKSAEKEQNA